jgi:outer membrane lipoprotein-sorting protein
MFRRLCVCVVVICGAYVPVHAGDEALPSVDEVIAKYIDAIGGRKALDSVKSMRMTGKMVMGGGMEAPLTIEFRRPEKMRMEFTFQGMTGTQAYDGESGWFIMPFTGKTDPEKMPPDMVKEIKRQADFEGPLVDYKKKGNKVEMEGTDELEGTPVYKLKVTRADGDVEHYLIDKDNYIILGTKGARTFQGTPVDFEVTFGDYKEVNGLMLPHSFSQKSSASMDHENTMVIDKIETNVDIPDSRFVMPEKKAEPKKSDEKG